MAANIDNIKGWLKEAIVKGSKYMLVVCDTFDGGDYPVYCETAEKALSEYNSAVKGENMKRLMECYDMSIDVEIQLQEHRAIHPPVVKETSETLSPLSVQICDIDECIKNFSKSMKSKLMKPENLEKGGWKDATTKDLLEKMALQFSLLVSKSWDNDPNPDEVLKRAVNVANYAMMIAGNVRNKNG